MSITRVFADRRLLLGILILVTGVIMTWLSPYFLEVNNLLSMTQYGAVIGLLALGQALVILGGGGGIDLSVGATLSLSGVFMGFLTEGHGMNPWLAAPLAIALGALLGLINGLLIAKVGLLPLIATLSTMFLYASLANVVTGGKQFGGFDVSNFSFVGQGTIVGIPVQVLLITLPAFAFAI